MRSGNYMPKVWVTIGKPILDSIGQASRPLKTNNPLFQQNLDWRLISIYGCHRKRVSLLALLIVACNLG